MKKRTAYSQYNLLKFHVLKILNEKKGWVWWAHIYEELPLEPKPQKDTFCSYMNALHKKGTYKSILHRKNGNYKREKKYSKRTYVNKKYIKGKVHYKITVSGKRILEKMNKGLNLKLQK